MIRAWNVLVPIMFCSAGCRSLMTAQLNDITNSAVPIRAYRANERFSNEYACALNDFIKTTLVGMRILKRWVVNRITFIWSFYTTATFLVGLLNVQYIGAGTMGLC